MGAGMESNEESVLSIDVDESEDATIDQSNNIGREEKLFQKMQG